jgi:hypothetical protein
LGGLGLWHKGSIGLEALVDGLSDGGWTAVRHAGALLVDGSNNEAKAAWENMVVDHRHHPAGTTSSLVLDESSALRSNDF